MAKLVNLNISNNTKYNIQIKSEELDVPHPTDGANLLTNQAHSTLNQSRLKETCNTDYNTIKSQTHPLNPRPSYQKAYTSIKINKN